MHHLVLLGEAAGRLGRQFHERYPELPWRALVAMRNVLIHEYFGVDMEEIWAAVERDVPTIKAELQKILQTLSAEETF
ncbi:MAG: HepT-like ribonuclease domain-containing protein [Candidatus Hydrogenedentota bacterium]